MRNLREAAQRLKNSSAREIESIAQHDWDMIRDVASGYLGTTSPTKEQPFVHDEDCELRGSSLCYCIDAGPKEEAEQVLRSIPASMSADGAVRHLALRVASLDANIERMKRVVEAARDVNNAGGNITLAR